MADKEAGTEAEAANGTGTNPESQPLNVAENGVAKEKESSPESDKVRMKKELGLLDGVAIILGIIIGSGKTPLLKYKTRLRSIIHSSLTQNKLIL